MTSTLCRWCGREVESITTDDGRQLARQCPLCLDWAPSGAEVGREPPPKKALTRSELKARAKVRAAKQARQLSLFGGRK